MVDTKLVLAQLNHINARTPFWVGAEVRELSKILVDRERIQHVVAGRYDGGFALLCSTSERLILIDKKPFYLTLEDIRYEMIASVDYLHRLVNATISVSTVHKALRFTSLRHAELRALSNHVQDMVMQLRQPQQYQQQATPDVLPMSVTPPVATVTNMPTNRYVNPYTRLPLVTRQRMMQLYMK